MQVKEKELDLKTQQMVLEFETRIKELEAKYQVQFDSNAIKREAMTTNKGGQSPQLGDIGDETQRQQQTFFNPNNSR